MARTTNRDLDERNGPRDLYAAIRQMFDPLMGVELDPMSREGVRDPTGGHWDQTFTNSESRPQARIEGRTTDR
jgi:hypothetical protein